MISFAVSVVIKATLVMALALLGLRLARHSRASVRHALLAASFGVLFLLPVASLVLPPLRLLLPPLRLLVPNAPAVARIKVRPTIGTTNQVNLTAPPSTIEPADLVLYAWAAGVVLFLLPMAIGLTQIQRFRRTSIPWRKDEDGREILLHEALPGPITCGILRPVVMLPREATMWPSEDLDRALVHEREHIRRGDLLSQCFARFVCALYWFHPLVWPAFRRLAMEAERACDDAVLQNSEPASYADQLVTLAQRLAASRKLPSLAMANRADLSTRVEALLDSTQQRGRAGSRFIVLACAAAVLIAAGLSPLAIVAAQQTADAPVPRFRANMMLVIEDVTVKDSNGKAIEGLSAGDFIVTEDGKPQTISIFEFQKLADPGVSSYYVLGYYSPNQSTDEQYRRTKITLNNAGDARLDYRAGYYTLKPAVPTATTQSVTHFKVAPDVKSPTLLFRVDPEYSEEARKAKYSGSVVVSVVVDTEGRARDIRVLKRLGMGLDEKAIEAVSRWKFKPGTKAGQPVEVQTEVEMNFRLL